jgi:hypothetical protein
MQQKEFLGTKKGGEIQTTMKLLYIGHYKENSGWSKAALNMIEAISTTDIDLVCKSVKLTGREPVLDKNILALENKDLNNVDYFLVIYLIII